MDNAFKLDMAGMNSSHPPKKVIDIPDGIPKGVFIQFCTPAIVKTAYGLEQAAAGDCIVHTPGVPRYLAPLPDAKQGFRNNWVHFHDDGLAGRLKHYGLRANVLLRDCERGEMQRLFAALFTEYLQPAPFTERKCQLLFEEILIHLARQQALPQGEQGQRSPKGEVLHSVEKLRLEVYSNPRENWTVPAMAQKVALSESWLNKVYKQVYHTTPKRDILLARLECAKNKLLFQGATLHCAAVESGFQNEFYFSRVFKRETGMTPGEYRQRGLERHS